MGVIRSHLVEYSIEFLAIIIRMQDGGRPVMDRQEESNDVLDRIRDTRTVRRWEVVARRRWYAVKRRLERRFVVRLLIRTVQEMATNDATHMAAGLAYYTFLSLFPLLLGTVVILSFFVDSNDIEHSISNVLDNYVPGSKDLVVANVQAVLQSRGAVGFLTVVGMLWTGSALFGVINRVVNRAWNVRRERPFFIGKPRQLLLVIVFGVLFVLSLAVVSAARLASELTGLGQVYDTLARFFLQGVSLALTYAIFLIVYKFMPNTKTHWRYVWLGALVAAVLFEICENGFILYLERFANFENVYGTLAPVLGLLVWAYVASLILILGAEMAAEYGRLSQGLERGVLIQPTKYSLRKDDERRKHYGLDVVGTRRRRRRRKT